MFSSLISSIGDDFREIASTLSGSSSKVKKESSKTSKKIEPKSFDTVLWPCKPAAFAKIPTVDETNLHVIPTGSLLFASRTGLFSQLNQALTGSNFDVMGIVLQSSVAGREGTYVYTSGVTMKTVQIIKLSDLLRDSTVKECHIRLLKDFNPNAPHLHEPSDFGDSHIDASEGSVQYGSDDELGKDFTPIGATEFRKSGETKFAETKLVPFKVEQSFNVEQTTDLKTQSSDLLNAMVFNTEKGKKVFIKSD